MKKIAKKFIAALLCAGIMLAGNFCFSERQTVQAAEQANTADICLKAEQATGNRVADEECGIVLRLEEGDHADWLYSVETAGDYYLNIRYKAIADTGDAIRISASLNGAIPFPAAEDFPLERIWQNGDQEKYDIYGNQIRPEQTEVFVWRNKTVCGTDAAAGNLIFSLCAGENRLTLSVIQEAVFIEQVSFVPVGSLPTYAQVRENYHALGYEKANAKIISLEAENDAVKSSQSLYPITDRSSPDVSPANATRICYNAVGGTQWQTAGQWIEWQIEVKESGLYELAFHYKQENKSDAVSVRQLFLDGAMPFAEAASVCFPAATGWDYFTVGDEEPYAFYLSAGTHSLQLRVGLGPYEKILKQTDTLITELNRIYRQIVVVTGVTPDVYRSYEFEKVIPETLNDMKTARERLADLEQQIRKAGFSGNQGTDAIKRIIQQADWMLEDTDTIARRLTSFRDNISALGTWRNGLAVQPLSLDKIYVAPDAELVERTRTNFWEKIWFGIRGFFNSYVSDYASIGKTEESAETEINVWMSTGRDQAQILRSLISQYFTPRSNVAVNLQLVPADSLLPALLAKTGPDVFIGLAQTEPLNLALRHAAVDLKKFKDYDEIAARFYPESLVPFELEGGVFALPDTLSYQMLFYRTDIADELGIDPEDLSTWEDLLQKVLPLVQKNGLTVGIPATVNTYLSMLYQLGGTAYCENGTQSGLNSAAAIGAMNTFETLYSQYQLAIAFDAANRFRSGEMPILVGDYLFYNQLTVFAPEIAGAWSMLPIPGVRRPDGALCQISQSTVTGTAIMASTEEATAAWAFVKWWLSGEIQADYGRELESVVGTAARYNTANIEAMDSVKWDAPIKKQLQIQRTQLQAFPEVPGGYLTAREFNFAFRSIVYQNDKVREAMTEATDAINKEITRKRDEYGLNETKE